jgi:hypothetical protein
MNHRLATLLDRESATTAATKNLEINLTENISAISIQMRGTNNTSVPTAVQATMLTKIELVDGSDVLESFTGKELEAMNINERGQPLFSERNFIDNNISIVAVEIPFGRYRYDEQLALDPNKFKNLQLNITHNKAAGGSVPDAGELSVFAHVFDEKAISPLGFLSTKEVFDYTLVASAHKYIDLPTDLTIRKLIIQSLYTALEPWSNVNKIRLYTDEQKKVIINDVRTSDLIRILAPEDNPYFTETLRISNSTTAYTCYVTPTSDVKMVWAPILGADSGYQGLASYGGTVTVDCSAATEGDLIVSGRCPHGAFVIPLGKQREIEDWFDASKVGSMKLDLTAGGSAAGTVQILTQQLRKY